MSPFDLLVSALATWYIAYVISAHSGPLRLLERLRRVEPLQEFLSCIYCLSIWVALTVYLVMSYPDYHRPLVEVPAIAGAALMLRAYTGAGLHGL